MAKSIREMDFVATLVKNRIKLKDGRVDLRATEQYRKLAESVIKIAQTDVRKFTFDQGAPNDINPDALAYFSRRAALQANTNDLMPSSIAWLQAETGGRDADYLV